MRCFHAIAHSDVGRVQHVDHVGAMGDLHGGRVRIAVDGDTRDARYISGVLIEPAGGTAARGQVIAERAAWYRTNLPTVRPTADGHPTLPTAHAGNEIDGFHVNSQVAAGTASTDTTITAR